MKITVLIPVYNEIHTIREILDRVQAMQMAEEILLVDDGSVDGTRDILHELNGQGPIRVIFHEHNQGKGAAVRTGLDHARGDV
ncbi:MAG: glycosyltransferase family 2 protein, partial [Chloroflexi bacterium]|nr:glycosyltransferase family 2 protein [Chloroflexota bacterium]